LFWELGSSLHTLSLEICLSDGRLEMWVVGSWQWMSLLCMRSGSEIVDVIRMVEAVDK